MKYTYEFATCSNTIEVTEEELKMLRELDAEEYNADRREEYHCTTGLDTQNDYGKWNEDIYEEESFMDQMIEKLPEAIASLKPAQKMILELYYFEHYTQSDIAEFLDITQGAVAQRISTAEKNLKKFLQKT